MAFPSFVKTLETNHLSLAREVTTTLQINLGLLCNQVCRHCHLSAGPHQTEIMSKETMAAVIDFARQTHFEFIDITGGAPEMNPHLVYLIESLAGLDSTLMLRSNLSALFDHADPELLPVLKKNKVVIVSSFPSLDRHQTDNQRGKGIFEKSISALQALNRIGYGVEGSGLELNLVSNPSGAFMPSSQDATQKRYRDVLKRKYQIEFNNAFTFANMPLGRFKQWLEKSGNYDAYIQNLVNNFNPCTIDGLMCKSLVSVSWDGYLYDCDFNLAAGLHKSNHKIHVSKADPKDFKGSPIAVDDHCYACTAGSGFT